MTILEQEVQDQEDFELKVSDRCDQCGAQAFVYVKGLSGELLFCGHHYAQNETGLNAWAYTIIDQRSAINKKSESSN